MIETLVPVGLSPTQQLPPGLITNGTMFDRQGRWGGGNLVRFNGGYPQPMGAFSTLSVSGTPPSGAATSGSYAYTDEAGHIVVAIGKLNALYVIHANARVTITPSGISSILSDTAFAWTFANLDGVLVAARSSSLGNPISGLGSIAQWDPSSSSVAVLINEGPDTSRAVFVTPEHFLMSIQGIRDIQWASQGTLNTWVPSTINSAGGLSIPSKSLVHSGIPVKAATLIFSEDDVWKIEYIGAPLYYGATQVGAGCGAIGPNVISVVGDTAYWMNAGGFFKYNGYVQPMRCDIADTIFNSSLQRQNGYRWFSLVNSPYNEIWWYYGDNQSTFIPNRVAIYNYADDTWSMGASVRQAGTDALWHTTTGDRICPVMVDIDGTTLYLHEVGSAISGAYVESGPFQIGPGDQTALVQRIIPDSRTVGDDITLFSGTFPGEAETVNGPYLSSGAVPLDARFRARYVRYKQVLSQSTSRVGIPRLGVIPSSRR